MDVQVQHFGKRQLGEVGGLIDQQIAAGFQSSFAEMNRMIVLHRIGPAEVIVPGISADVAKDRPAVAFAGFGRAPDVVDEFMIVERKIARHVAVPFREFHAPR